MQITFFKNEEHFTRHASLICFNSNVKGAEQSRTLRLGWVVVGLSVVLFGMYLWFDRSAISQRNWQILFASLVVVPVHEFLHAFYLWMTGRKVKAIRFFPPKSRSTDRAVIAYVMHALSAFKRYERALCYLFPLIWLTGLPLVLALFLPSLRVILLYLSLLNMSVSMFDVEDAFNLLFLPKGAVEIYGMWITVMSNEPITMHLFELPVNSDEIIHRTYRYERDMLNEVIPAEMDDKVKATFAEFRKQFNLPETTES